MTRSPAPYHVTSGVDIYDAESELIASCNVPYGKPYALARAQANARLLVAAPALLAALDGLAAILLGTATMWDRLTPDQQQVVQLAQDLHHSLEEE